MSTRRLDMLTRQITAFENWFTFTVALEQGYCPTLRTFDQEDMSLRDTLVVTLRNEVARQGYPVYVGDGKFLGR